MRVEVGKFKVEGRGWMLVSIAVAMLDVIQLIAGG